MKSGFSSEFCAHSAGANGEWEPLARHLKDVAQRSAEFASVFEAADEAYNAGLLHDLGKYGQLFQRRLHGQEKGIDHWTAGAWKALRALHGCAVALAVEGHHHGLKRGDRASLKLLGNRPLDGPHPSRLRFSELTDPKGELLLRRFAEDGLALRELTSSLAQFHPHAHAAAMLDVRMLYSALVDADFLATEAHFSGNVRPEPVRFEAARWLKALQMHIGQLAKDAEQKRISETVLGLRAVLRSKCRAAAERSPGLFTLTAPTGTGKTLAMLEFALSHARRWGLRRVVIVAPYLSILDQTADAIRNALSLGQNPRILLEHHSLAIDVGSSGDDVRREQECIAENWDAPIIVTTNVQLLESLFSNRPAACRKVHRLAKSVILFDEVQTLPLKLVLPTLATLTRLSDRYGSTVVFSTATQPAFEVLSETLRQRNLTQSRWEPREINSGAKKMFVDAKRVRYTWPRLEEKLPWSELAGLMLRDDGQALCVVNTKAQATELFRELQARSARPLFHLSTAMCPAHRRRVLNEIRVLLKYGMPCLVVATQCVEAGVDLDFPRVFRAMGPLDSIAQAAGRCNRNQRSTLGEVRIFRPAEGKFPRDNAYKNGAAIAERMQGRDLHDPVVFTDYYRELYCVQNVQEADSDLLRAIEALDFEAVAKQYRLIDDNSVNLLTPYDLGAVLAAEVRQSHLSADWVRRARAYSVNLLRYELDKNPECFEAVPLAHGNAPDWWILLGDGTYDDRLGLQLPSERSCMWQV
jgi:CRISPR-associated helicase Cas3/CRISPR-associated endonuclease Cas3-HD